MNLKEIAKAAKVSQSTVSMVLHDQKGISLATKQRVEPLLEANGYVIERKKPVARGKLPKVMFIKYKKHSLMVDGNYEYTSRLTDELGINCLKAGYELVLTVATNDTLSGVFDRINIEAYEGILLLGTEFSNEERHLLHNVHKPIVIIDNDLVKLSVTSVSTHTWNSMRRKVEYLLNLGHTRIGYVRNTCPTSICTECFRGFKNAMWEYQLPLKDEYVFDIAPTFNGAYESMKKLLADGVTLPSALVSNSDVMALGVMKALQENGVKIPENVSIIGGDNIMSCTMYSPQLTTCDAHPCEIGKWAVKLLQEQIETPDAPVVRLRIETTIIERESVCNYEHWLPFSQKEREAAAQSSPSE